MIPLKLIFHEGHGVIDCLIARQTRSPITHVAVQIDMVVYEARPFAGVTQSTYEAHRDTAIWIGTTLHELYVTELSFSKARILRQQMLNELGCHYDWRNVFSFVTKGREESNTRWFCSELAMQVALWAGIRLLNNIEPACVSPGMLYTSPLLKESL